MKIIMSRAVYNRFFEVGTRFAQDVGLEVNADDWSPEQSLAVQVDALMTSRNVSMQLSEDEIVINVNDCVLLAAAKVYDKMFGILSSVISVVKLAAPSLKESVAEYQRLIFEQTTD